MSKKMAISYRLVSFLRRFFYTRPDYTRIRLLERFQLHVYALPLMSFISWNWYRMPSYFWALLTKKNIQILFFSFEYDGRFSNFEKEIQKLSGSFFYFEVPIFCFLYNEVCFQSFFEDYARKNPELGRYVNVFQRYYHPDNENNRKIYAAHCEKVLRLFKFLFPRLTMFANASPDDSYCIELVPVAQNLGIKWFLFEREGVHTERSAKALAQLFQHYNPLRVDAFFAANELHQKCYMDSSIGARRKPQFHLLGEPRSDRWVKNQYELLDPRYHQWKTYKKRVMFLTFGEKNYIEPMYHPHVSGSWLPLLHQTEDVLFEFVGRHPEYLVIYKMGHTEDFHQEFVDRCNKANYNNMVPLDRSFPCDELLRTVDLVIAFQSTATLEAFFVNPEIVYLNWALPNNVDKEIDILPFHRCYAMKHANSPEQFAAFLRQWHEGKTSISFEELEQRRAWRESYFHQPDGNVARRAAELIQLELS